ncbi:glycoside hydrolase family 16 protein [Actinoplanes sp. NPDC026619]|uniref:glycoside hydrolase family 16 protein n=1 Tax=Actinoplanes sp. NPDC026619 TaxID=3155798 RepID=UPI0033E55D7F
MKRRLVVAATAALAVVAVAFAVRSGPAPSPAPEVAVTTSAPRVESTATTPVPHTRDEAAQRYGWGEPVVSQSDEYNDSAVDLDKWGLFGVDAGESTGCSAGYHEHGQRCASQTAEGGGYLSVTGTADGKTGGLWGRMSAFRYGRVEVRERAVPLANNGGKAYHAVPLIWPDDEDDWENAEIDFAERDVGAGAVSLYVHHDGTKNCTAPIDSTRFHNYAVDWQPDSISWFVDGVRKCTVKASIDSFSRSNGGAQMDMFPADGTLMQPARQDVDWVRMYATAATEYQSPS